MKYSFTLLAGLYCLTALGVCAQTNGIPKIQFDETVYDFGATSQVTTVSGIFHFKNTGDGILKVDPPKPSCGCTAAQVMPDTLPPGTTGIIPFTLNLGFNRGTLVKHITVHSNDPLTPEVSLTITVDYTPLYNLDPLAISPNIAFGVTETNATTTLTRTDGKPLQIVRLEPSQPWIKATVEPGGGPDATNAQIHVTVQRDGPPHRFNEYVRIYTASDSNSPASSIYLYGEVLGEVSVIPESLYWSVTDSGNAGTPQTQATQRISIRSASGQPIELKNPQSTIKGLKVELLPLEAGKEYELVARLDNVPASTVSGNVSFETSVATQPRIEVPVIVNVFKP
jgi:hypothetical protein